MNSQVCFFVDSKGKRNEEMVIKSLQDMNLDQAKETGDTAGHIDHISLKSKSPVSLEIHLPSTFGKPNETVLFIASHLIFIRTG